MGDYYVTVGRKGLSAYWNWRILRRSRPLGVKLRGSGGYRSESSARAAGARALSDFLRALAKDPEIDREALAAATQSDADIVSVADRI